jgi:glycerophosphoryl diester phosphodiesterase
MNNQNTCLIFAHRGGNKEAGAIIAENTRAAFNYALQYPIDGFETDVQLSLDEVPVLWHDWELDKLGYQGKCIDDFDFAQLEQMDFAGYSSPDALPEGALSLKEFIDSYRGRCGLNIELKSRDEESQQRLETKILQMLAIIGTSAADDVFISSYSLPGLIFAHQHAPDLPLYYLLSDHHTQTDIKQFLTNLPGANLHLPAGCRAGKPGMKDYSFLAGFCLPIDIHNESIAKLLREQGKGVGVYTCNSAEEIQKALDLKVNILITDYPQLALRIRGS